MFIGMSSTFDAARKFLMSYETFQFLYLFIVFELTEVFISCFNMLTFHHQMSLISYIKRVNKDKVNEIGPTSRTLIMK